MRLPIKKTFCIISLLLLTLPAVNSFALDSEELKQKLEQLQKTGSPEESRDELEKRLNILKGLLKEEDITEDERKGLEEKLKMLKKQLPPREKFLISFEEVPLEPNGKRFFIEGRYWLANIVGGDKEAASLYSQETKQPVGSPQNVTPAPFGGFVVAAGYRHSHERTTMIKLWRLDSSASLTRSATSTIGISGTEGSDYYYQNIKQWGISTFATKGVDRVDAESRINATNVDLLHAMTIGKGGDKEVGIALGLKYAQVDSNYAITYSSTTTQLYNIKSDVENTLIGPVFGIYGSGNVFDKLRFKGLLDISVAWDHVKARRFEYDHTTPQTAVDAGQAKDLAVTAIGSELGIIYPFGQNLSFGLDYKSAYFGGLPFDLNPAGAFLN
ncbi:MAG: hypothetical protein AAB275_04460, partial [Deltaproteobacteria bacterium]